MGLYGWKQLVLWSIEHSCLGTEERTDLLRHWEGLWTTFLEWLVEKYGDDDDTTEQ
jgi:adenosine deaminase CECR1